jgi:hypothetical protein
LILPFFALNPFLFSFFSLHLLSFLQSVPNGGNFLPLTPDTFLAILLPSISVCQIFVSWISIYRQNMHPYIVRRGTMALICWNILFSDPIFITVWRRPMDIVHKYVSKQWHQDVPIDLGQFLWEMVRKIWDQCLVEEWCGQEPHMLEHGTHRCYDNPSLPNHSCFLIPGRVEGLSLYDSCIVAFLLAVLFL